MTTFAHRFPVWSFVGSLLSARIFIYFFLIRIPWQFTHWQFSRPLFGWDLTRPLGIVIIAMGVPVIVGFLERFVREGHGTPVPVAPPRHLVIGGVYRYVRNPAYVAAVAIVLGQGLLFGSWPVVAYAAAGLVAFHAFVVFYEEPTLRASFGSDYEAYCREVPRWIPRMRNRSVKPREVS